MNKLNLTRRVMKLFLIAIASQALLFSQYPDQGDNPYPSEIEGQTSPSYDPNKSGNSRQEPSQSYSEDNYPPQIENYFPPVWENPSNPSPDSWQAPSSIPPDGRWPSYSNSGSVEQQQTQQQAQQQLLQPVQQQQQQEAQQQQQPVEQQPQPQFYSPQNQTSYPNFNQKFTQEQSDYFSAPSNNWQDSSTQNYYPTQTPDQYSSQNQYQTESWQNPPQTQYSIESYQIPPQHQYQTESWQQPYQTQIQAESCQYPVITYPEYCYPNDWPNNNSNYSNIPQTTYSNIPQTTYSNIPQTTFQQPAPVDEFSHYPPAKWDNVNSNLTTFNPDIADDPDKEQHPLSPAGQAKAYQFDGKEVIPRPIQPYANENSPQKNTQSTFSSEKLSNGSKTQLANDTGDIDDELLKNQSTKSKKKADDNSKKTNGKSDNLEIDSDGDEEIAQQNPLQPNMPRPLSIITPNSANNNPQTAVLDPTIGKTSNEISVNFNNLAMVEYIRFVSRVTNKNFIFDDEDLHFTVTIVSEEPISVQNLMTALLQELRIRDLSIIEQGNNIIIHRNPRVRAPSRIVAEGTNFLSSHESELVTRVFRLNTLDPVKASDLIRPLLSDESLIEVLKDTNNLVITDLVSNVNKIAQLISNLDAPNSGVTFGEYLVRNAFVDSLADIVTRILQPIAQGNPYIIVPHAVSNSIYIISNAFIVEKALAILQNLDVTQGSTKILPLETLQPNYELEPPPPSSWRTWLYF